MYLTDEQRDRIARRAEDAGVSQAEIIRRILDEALGLGDDVGQRVRAVVDTAGLFEDRPDWPDWLDEVRGRSTSDRLEELGL